MPNLSCRSIKFDAEQGYSGADAILLDGNPVNARTMIAVQTLSMIDVEYDEFS